MVYSPCFTVVNFYFKKRRALAISIHLLGTGIGSVVFPFIYHSLIHCYGLQGAVLVISALSLNICVCAALIRQPQELQKGKIPLSKQTSTETNSYELENDIIKPRRSCCECSTRRPIREIFHFSLFRIPSFLIYALAFMCSIYAYFSIFTMIPGHARVQGMSSARVAVLLSVNGGVMIFARPVVGLLADSEIIQKRNIIGTFFYSWRSFLHYFAMVYGILSLVGLFSNTRAVPRFFLYVHSPFITGNSSPRKSSAGSRTFESLSIVTRWHFTAIYRYVNTLSYIFFHHKNLCFISLMKSVSFQWVISPF